MKAKERSRRRVKRNTEKNKIMVQLIRENNLIKSNIESFNLVAQEEDEEGEEEEGVEVEGMAEEENLEEESSSKNGTKRRSKYSPLSSIIADIFLISNFINRQSHCISSNSQASIF